MSSPEGTTTSSWSELGKTPSPATPGAPTPQDPAVLKSQALELLAILSTWDVATQGNLIDDQDTLGHYIQVWYHFNDLAEVEPAVASDLQLKSARASTHSSDIPCWGVTASGLRSRDCKVRATKGFRCGRHIADGLEDHLQPDEDPHRECTTVCYVCSSPFDSTTSPLRCGLCPRSTHVSCLERKLLGADISQLETSKLACEACDIFRAPDFATYLAARSVEVQTLSSSDIWWSEETRLKLAGIAREGLKELLYFPLHLSLCSTFMKAGVLHWRSTMGNAQLGQTPCTGVVLLRTVSQLNTELSPVNEEEELAPKNLTGNMEDVVAEVAKEEVSLPGPNPPEPAANIEGVIQQVENLTIAEKVLGKSAISAAFEPEVVTLPAQLASKETVLATQSGVQPESSKVAQLRAEMIQAGGKPRTGAFQRELLRVTGETALNSVVAKAPDASTQIVCPPVTALQSASQSLPSSPELTAMMNILKGLQGELSGVRAEMSSLKSAGVASTGEIFPTRPFTSRYGKKEGTDAFGIHVSNQAHFESPEAECGIDWLGLGDSSAQLTRPDRVRSLIGSASVFYNKSGVRDSFDSDTPKESRFEEYLAQLSKHWLDILRDGQSSVYTESGSFHRVLGRYILAVLQYLMAVKRAGMTRYSPNWDWPMTWQYLKVIVSELFQGRKMDTATAFSKWLLSLVTEPMIDSLDGYFVLMPNEDVIAVANHNINDRYMRAAGLLDFKSTGYAKSLRTGVGKEDEQNVPYAQLSRRPWSTCIGCWKPRTECKGYNEKTGYHCVNKLHPNMRHNTPECGHKHLWEKLGGPRATPCGKDEPWPLGEKKTSLDKVKRDP